MNLWTRIWSAYDERVPSRVKGFRGATFLNRFLFDLSFREADGYCLERDGEKICFARRQPVRRIRDEKLIEGYIKEVEFSFRSSRERGRSPYARKYGTEMAFWILKVERFRSSSPPVGGFHLQRELCLENLAEDGRVSFFAVSSQNFGNPGSMEYAQ